MMPDSLGSACLKAAAAAGALVATPTFAEPSDRKLQFGANYTSDSIGNFRGGLKTGFSQMGMLELTADAEGKLFSIDDVSAHANVQYVHGRSLNGRLISDAQVTSNIDAPNGIRLFEAWISVPVARNGFVKAGLIDLNSEFDVQDVGALFLNSSHGIGPDFSQSGRNGPSIFPTTSSAVVAGVSEGGMSFRAGVFDAVSGNPEHPRRTVVRFPGHTGLLLVGEAEFRVAEHAEFQLGGWTYTTRFETVSNPDDRRGGNRGAYAMVESRLGALGGRPVEGWVRVGTADEVQPDRVLFRWRRRRRTREAPPRDRGRPRWAGQASTAHSRSKGGDGRRADVRARNRRTRRRPTGCTICDRSRL